MDADSECFYCKYLLPLFVAIFLVSFLCPYPLTLKSTRMIEKVKLSEVATGNPVSLIGLTSGQSLAQMPIDRLPKTEYIAMASGTDKLRYTQLRYSTTSGAGSRILLIVPISGLTDKMDAAGAFGSLYVLRAGMSYMPMMVKADIMLFRSSSFLVNDMNVMGASADGPVNFKLGHCTYEGQLYLAVKFNTEFSIITCFQGFYTSDCVFRNVLEENVTDWTDLL